MVTECHHGNDGGLDAAYAEIPEAERETWYHRAERALEAAAERPGWLVRGR